jgi:hypothetical protein
LSLFLLLIVLTVHLPAVLDAPDAGARRFPMTNLIKDTGLAAAALLVAAKEQRNNRVGCQNKTSRSKREDDVAFYPRIKMALKSAQ